MERKPGVLLLGPLPPPYMGPSIATKIILGSRLKEYFTLYHLDTNTHKRISTLGKWTLARIGRNIILYLRMALIIMTRRPDLVVIPISQTTSGFLKDSIFIIISRFFFRKTLLQLRGGNFKNWLNSASAITGRYVSTVLHKTQGIIVLGEKIRHLFKDIFNDDRIFVVPNGANYSIAPVSGRNSGGLKVLYIGNLQPSKGIEDVLEALILIKDKGGQADFHVDVAGDWLDGITRDKCLRVVDENNLPVTFRPPVTGMDKFNFLSGADIFIFPPREPEGHPWVIVEAMAAGLPIISTDQGAITESVIDGVNGFIVEKRNPEQIAEKIKLLIENPELRIKMGEQSRRLYEENFTEEKMVEKLRMCFDQVLKS